MSNIWFASDHHFGHEGPYNKFTREDGSFLRADLATNADEADELMIQRHNAVVKPQDRVYFVGDFCFSKKHIYKADRMNGHKVLIKGNHDTLELKTYLPFFEDIRGCHQFDGMFISHVPIHPQSLGRWGFNVHGHLHALRVMELDMKGNNTDIIDLRYFNVSVEQINYTPISLEEVKKHKPALELKPRD
jgi:calcineurin-like phosphoesterase family protein